jgi:hypothetical protein
LLRENKRLFHSEALKFSTLFINKTMGVLIIHGENTPVPVCQQFGVIPRHQFKNDKTYRNVKA